MIKFQIYRKIILSYDIVPGSGIRPCILINTPQVVYRFSQHYEMRPITMSIIFHKFLTFSRQKCNNKIILESYLTFVHLLYWLFLLLVAQKAIKCTASFAFYLFSAICFIYSIKHEHSCKILYVILYIPVW